MCRNNFSSFAKITTIIVCVMVSKGYSAWPDTNTPLDINLIRITSQDKGMGTNLQKLEDQCLSLIKDYNSPRDKGKIYAKIASMYASKGYSSPNDIRIEKAAQYCWKSLEYPLDTLTACEIYSRFSGAQVAPSWDGPEADFVKARKEAIVTCLTGLKLALDNNAPKESGPGSDFEQRLYIFRRMSIEFCVSLYSHKPYDAAELEKFARDILKGRNNVIDEIMSKVRDRIQQQGK
jgi:hypothetical protein